MRPLLLLAAAPFLASCATGPDYRVIPPPVQRDYRPGLINPILDLDENMRFEELPSFRRKLTAFVRDRTSRASTVSEMAIYFRDLNNGPWFGIDQDKKFAPASLLKVPVMMSLLKQAEDRPGLLQMQIGSAQLPPAQPQLIKAGKSVEPGRLYSVNDLLELMIAYSDNGAHNLLIPLLDEAVYKDIFDDLGVPTADLSAPEAFMTVRQYAAFFRILYNASYLSRTMSRKALAILSHSDFRAGIAAGVPQGITIANKFGEREYGDGALQLHDCGIVYHPKHPYLLCIMTRGRSLPAQEKAISDASALVWHEVDSPQ